MKSIIFIYFLLAYTLLPAQGFRLAYYSPSVSDFSKADLITASNMYIKEVGTEIEFNSISTIYNDPNKLALDLKNGKIDYVVASGLDFVKYFDTSLLVDGFIKGYFDGTHDRFLILVTKNSPIKNIEDLYKKKIAIKKSDEIIKLYLENQLLKQGKDYKVTYENFTTRQRALLKLFFGKVDAAVVTKKSLSLLGELNPQILNKVRILKDTNIIADNFGLLHKSVDENMRHFLRKKTKELHTHTRGRQLLTLYKTEVVADSKVKDLQPIEVLYKETQKLKLKNKEKNK